MAANDKGVETSAGTDFIRTVINADLESGKHEQVVTRFPPEPNGYLHIGHAKAICLNFGISEEYPEARCHLRFDDTNPLKEETEYIDAIKDDVRWLGFDWGEHLHFASDYFEKLYAYALHLIHQGNAYVDDLSAEEIREYRGTLQEPGRPSPYRDRSVEENLDLFERMKRGEFADGAKVLRAKIDMASGNMNLRDPTIYRIRHAVHPRTGDAWCVYPMYDYTHCLSDAIEGITHSLCSLEFEDHRPLYDWVLDQLETPCHPQQIEFARLNLSFTVLSKRKLLRLVNEGRVSGWDDPRMPSLAGLRRRGCPPEAIVDLCERVGIAKADSVVDIALFEHCLRDYLNTRAPRVMCVLRPLKVVITNYPEGEVDELDAPYLPDDPERMGYRKISFSKEIYIEREDFMEEPFRKYFRLAPGREVRLRWAYLLTCDEVIKNADGEVTELRCHIDPDSRGGNSPDGRKVKGTIHWVSAQHGLPVEVRLYDRLFSVEKPDAEKDKDYVELINPESLITLKGSVAEPSLSGAEPGSRHQFERQGYFCVDPVDSEPGALVFNRIVPLRDSWAKILKKQKAAH